MHVGVHVTLRAPVGVELFQGQEPGVDGWMLPPQVVALVVGQRSIHSLHIGNEHQIHCPWSSCIQPRALLSKQFPFKPLRDLAELLPGPLIGPFPEAGSAKPQAPGLKQQPFQLPQSKSLTAVHRQAQRAEPFFQCEQDLVALRDQPPAQLESGKHAGGNPIEKPGFLAAIAAHGHLADPIGNPLELQP